MVLRAICCQNASPASLAYRVGVRDREKESTDVERRKNMTSNQIAYWNMVETERANRAREGENFRHNISTEDVAAKTLQETGRHNAATEVETRRHNRRDENIKVADTVIKGVKTVADAINDRVNAEANVVRAIVPFT